jgi:hypothetical protein
MLNFICTTVVCVQQYLGTGYIQASHGQRFIWNGSNQDYVCATTSSMQTYNIYNCNRIELSKAYIQN